MKRVLAFLLFSTAALAADFISFGVKGGVPFTDAFKTARTGNLGYVTDTRRYTFGPTVELNLPFSLGVEFDALYRRLNFEGTDQPLDIFVRRTVTADAWDFPLLLKIRMAPGPIKPYLSVGPTFRGLARLKQVGQFFNRPGEGEDTPAELERRMNTGFTAGFGVRLSAPVIAISPELRYTRWGWDNFRDTRGLLQSNRDQFEFMLGITF